MFPQFLVQNILLVENSTFIQQRFAELFNTNVFYTQKLIDELTHYKDSLQLWKEVDTDDPARLQYHEYCYTDKGALVGQVGKNSGQQVTIYQPLLKYESTLVSRGSYISLKDNTLTLVTDPSKPSLIRTFYVAGLKTIQRINIQQWSYKDGCYKFNFDPSQTQWLSGTRSKPSSEEPMGSNYTWCQFVFEEDIVLGRLFFEPNHVFVRDIFVKIERVWDPYTTKYNYAWTFQSPKLPNNVIVELY